MQPFFYSFKIFLAKILIFSRLKNIFFNEFLFFFNCLNNDIAIFTKSFPSCSQNGLKDLSKIKIRAGL